MAVLSSRRRLLAYPFALATLVAASAIRAEYTPHLLRIGYQKSGLVLGRLRAQGTLEKVLAPSGFQVKWVEFPAGPQLLEGLNVGSIDFGYVGEAPPIFAQAAGANFVYVGYELPSPQAEAVLVPKNSPLHAVADLKGKRVALNKGSNVHYLLVKLLEKAGVKYSDVQVVFLTPADARAAFERGAVDAWVIWEPFQSAAEKQVDGRILADGTGVVSNHDFFLAEREFATKNPEVIRQLFDEVHQTGQSMKKDPAAAAAQLTAINGLDAAVLEQAIRRSSLSVQPINEAVLVEQQKLADTFLELKLIPKPIRVRDAALFAPR